MQTFYMVFCRCFVLTYCSTNKKNCFHQNVANNTSPNPKWQFFGQLADGTNNGIMLNTDFELFYNLTLDPTTAKTTCTLNSTCGLTNSCNNYCPMSTTFNQALSYSTVSYFYSIELK